MIPCATKGLIMLSMLRRTFYGSYKHSGLAKLPKRRRFDMVDRALGSFLSTGSGRVIDLGCGTGADFAQFVRNPQIDIYGLDRVERPRCVPFHFIQGDICRVDVPDHHFDAAVSIGVLEHIAPMEKLAEAILEMRRIAKSYCVIVPSISTILEPHTTRWFYPLGRGGYGGTLNYMSDETWLRFEGFENARAERFTYLPLISNLIISGHNRDGACITQESAGEQSRSACG